MKSVAYCKTGTPAWLQRLLDRGRGCWICSKDEACLNDGRASVGFARSSTDEETCVAGEGMTADEADDLTSVEVSSILGKS